MLPFIVLAILVFALSGTRRPNGPGNGGNGSDGDDDTDGGNGEGSPTDVQITGTHSQLYIVPPGEIHELTAGVQFNNVSLVVRGILRARPGASLTIAGTNYANYTAGQPTDPVTQVGLHVMNGGRLDFQGTPITPWNYVGDDPSWQAGHEIMATPHRFGDITSTAHTKGADPPVNRYGEPTEVFNLTRDIVIQGTPGHNAFVMFHPDAGVGMVEYTTFRHLGIPLYDQDGNNLGLAGRFAIHHHQREDRSRREVWRGNVIRDSLNHGIWPHNSHGMSFLDTIVYNVESEGVAWDRGFGRDANLGNESHDGYYEGNLVTDIKWTPRFRSNAQGFILAMGKNNVIGPRNVVCGVQGKGLVWAEIGGGFADYIPWVHNFPVKVHHGNPDIDDRAGVDVWQNPEGNLIDDFPVDVTSWHVGVRMGAYVTSRFTYRIQRVRDCNIGLESHAQGGDRGDGYGLRILGEGPVMDCGVGLSIERHNGFAGVPVLYLNIPFINCGTIIRERSGGGQHPSRSDLIGCTVDGQPLTSFLTSGQRAPTSIYNPASPHSSSVLRVQNGNTAFQISSNGMVSSISVFN